MKLWLIYQVADSTGEFDTPVLYAVTTEKSLFKDFMNTRKTEYFRVIKKADVLESNWRTFRNTHKAYRLIRVKVETSRETKFDPKHIEVVMTEREEELVYLRQDQIYQELAKHTFPNAKLFCEELIRALDVINFFEIYWYYADDRSSFYSCYTKEMKDFNEYPEDMIRVKWDMFSIFMYFFGNTMKDTFNNLDERQ